MTNTDDQSTEDYQKSYDEIWRQKPRLRSLISRDTKPVYEEFQDPRTGEWRSRIRMSRDKFDETAKGVFLEEFSKWGRMGEAAAAAGVTAQTVRAHMERDEEFGDAVMLAEEEYKDKLISHHQNLVFNGTQKKSYDRNGNLISEETIYPIRLIELELKKHDKGYRDKQEVEINHTGGVLVAPSEVKSIDDWEARFAQAKDVTPPTGQIGTTEDEDDEPF